MEQKYSHLINRDRSIRLLAKNACFRAIFVKSTNLSREAAERHNLNSKASILLSKIMTAAALIASTLKGEERAIIELISNGYFKKVLGEASQNGEIRGYVQINDNLTNSNIEIGSGYFMVTRILYDHAEPLTGIIELQDGDIDANLSYYYYKSEQIPTGVIISAELDSDGIIKYAGGLMVQAMPGYKRNDLEKIYNSMNQIKSLEEAILCDENQSIEFLKNHLPFDFDILKSCIDSNLAHEGEKELKKTVNIFCHTLEQHDIPYLLEYSGNRGFHVWITFEEAVNYRTGFDIQQAIIQEVGLDFNRDLIGLDLFPHSATPTGGVGLGVKIPLSKHKKSGYYSYLLSCITEIEAVQKFSYLSDNILLDNINILEGHSSISRSKRLCCTNLSLKAYSTI